MRKAEPLNDEDMDAVRETMRSQGWKVVMGKVLGPIMDDMESVRGVDTLKGLQARKLALQMLETLVSGCAAIAASDPVEEARRLEAEMKDSIYRIR